MNAQGTELVNKMFQNAYQATEANLKLQQEMLLGWTRLLPGFSGRGQAPGLSNFPTQWSDMVSNVARWQRDLVDYQFDAAMKSLDTLMGAAKGSNGASAGSAATAAKPKAPTPAPPPAEEEVPRIPSGPVRNIHQKVAIVTGGASGIGAAVANELAHRGARAVLMVDRNEAVKEVAASINDTSDRPVAFAKVGNTMDEAFRKKVFNEAAEEFGLVSICVPAAGITRDALAVHVDKETGKAEVYPVDTFRQVAEVNLIAPIYWAMEMIARIAEDRAARGLKRWNPDERIQGAVVFLGSVSSQGNKGQISYAVTKAGLEGAAATLTKEAIFHGVRCGIIHPGFTNTPMVQALGEEYLQKNVLPYTQLRRLIRPEEIADAICFMISNSAVSGELWADAGWHPPA